MKRSTLLLSSSSSKRTVEDACKSWAFRTIPNSCKPHSHSAYAHSLATSLMAPEFAKHSMCLNGRAKCLLESAQEHSGILRIFSA